MGMSMVLYQRSFPTDITNEMGGCIWSSQRDEKLIQSVETAENESGKQSSWWPFSSKSNTNESELPKTDLNANSDQDIATAVATAFGATETREQNLESNNIADIKKESLDAAIENISKPSNNDQVDNISQDLLQDKEIISSNITKELISDSITKVQENHETKVIENDASQIDQVAID